MSIPEKLYDKMPIFMQNIMISIKGILNQSARYGKAYYAHRDFLQKYDEWSLEEKKDYQNEQLRRFLKHTVENSVFYQGLYKDVDINAIKTVDDLYKLPMVDKEMLRANIEDVVAVDKRGTIEGHTGGTTGKSLVVIRTKEDMMVRMAELDHFKEKHGYLHLKEKRATFNGKHIVPSTQKKKIFWRYNIACKQMIFSSFHITEDNIPYYVKKMNRFKPRAIDGFFTSICDIANYIERNGIKLSFTPIAVFPTSETLTETGRKLIERVFGCRVYDQYASSEGAPFVTECENGNLHMQLSTGVFEHFEDGSDEILITSFTTHGTPLIRYRIGDSMEFDDNNDCTCGDNQPIVRSIEGRKLDFLYTAEGAKINAGNISNLFKNIPNSLIRAQLIQNEKNIVEARLEVDKEKYKSEYDDLLMKEFEHKFGRNTKLIIKHVDHIEREKSGKFRMIKNNVK